MANPEWDNYKTKPKPAAWEWERYISHFCDNSGYWQWECSQEYPQIMHQENLKNPKRYRNLRPLYRGDAK